MKAATRVYKMHYAVGRYVQAHNRYDKTRHEDRMVGELICRAHSIVHATIILRKVVGHPQFEITQTWIQEGTTWRNVDESRRNTN